MTEAEETKTKSTQTVKDGKKIADIAGNALKIISKI